MDLIEAKLEGGMKNSLRVGVILTLFISSICLANKFPYPQQFPAVLGNWHQVTVQRGDNVAKLARKNGVSMHNVLLHNPRLRQQKYLQPGEAIIIPSCFWVPENIPSGEILINIATQTLFYHPTEKNELWVFPVTVGKPDNPTPVGEFYIKKKKTNPTWYPTESVRASYAKKGVSLPFAVEGGAGNPLGAYALYLNKPTYLIHTASGIKALGGRQSFGCVRMYEHNIEQLYAMVPVKTKVRIIDEPNPHEDKMFNYCSKSL